MEVVPDYINPYSTHIILTKNGRTSVLYKFYGTRCEDGGSFREIGAIEPLGVNRTPGLLTKNLVQLFIGQFSAYIRFLSECIPHSVWLAR